MARSSEPCEIMTSIAIACSVQHCWDLYIDNTLTTQWSPAVTKVDFQHERSELGNLRKSHIQVGGKEGHTVEQCTSLKPLTRIEFTVLEETFGFSHMLNQYGFSMSFDADEAATLMSMATHYVPKKIFASVMTSAPTQQQIMGLMTESLSSFKRFAENVKPTSTK